MLSVYNHFLNKITTSLAHENYIIICALKDIFFFYIVADKKEKTKSTYYIFTMNDCRLIFTKCA